MKKKIFAVALTLATAMGGYLTYNESEADGLSDITKANIEALADIDLLCPNGCVADGEGCYCHGWYDSYKEYDGWPDPETFE